MDPLRQIIAAIKIPDPARVRDLLRLNPELVNARDETGDSILLMSIYRRLPEIQDIILDWGPNLNLFEAAALGDVATLGKLLGLYPRLVNAYSHDGFTALHLAVFFGREEAAAALLDTGADVNAVSRNQTFARLVTPLHSAVAGGRVDIVRLLLARGANVNAKQGDGDTPLHAAAFAGDADLVRELLINGADRHLRSDDQRTASDLAGEKGLSDIVRLLS